MYYFFAIVWSDSCTDSSFVLVSAYDVAFATAISAESEATLFVSLSSYMGVMCLILKK